MELVYPIYLDTMMMTAFLASLEGGIIEEANIEGKTSDATKKTRKSSFGAKVSNLLSYVVDINAQAEFSKDSSENAESQYKGIVRFPQASLFIRLRNLLLEQDLIKSVSSSKDISKVSVGDLVEIQGIVKPSPNFELSRALRQLIPIVIPALQLEVTQIEHQLTDYKNLAKSGKGIKKIPIGNEVFDFSVVVEATEHQLKAKQSQLVNIQGLETVIGNLFTEENLSNVVFESSNFSSICKVYPVFSRNERIEEIFDAKWSCLGKVIGKLETNDSYDLFKGLPVGLLAKNIYSSMVTGLQTEELNINVSNPIISGEGLIIASLAIFA